MARKLRVGNDIIRLLTPLLQRNRRPCSGCTTDTPSVSLPMREVIRHSGLGAGGTSTLTVHDFDVCRPTRWSMSLTRRRNPECCPAHKTWTLEDAARLLLAAHVVRVATFGADPARTPTRQMR